LFLIKNTNNYQKNNEYWPHYPKTLPINEVFLICIAKSLKHLFAEKHEIAESSTFAFPK